MRFEVIVKINGVNKYLETSEYASFPINYNIADIADISKKNSSYSKTLSFPDTKNNRKVFEYIFSIQSDSTFDPTKKSRCWILKDTLLQLEGFLQLTDIVYDNEGNRSSYNCVIYADNGNLFTNIGEKLLSDLDLSQFDHNWTINSITQSWTRDYTNGYYYPLIDYGFGLDTQKLSSGLSVNYFYPSYYLKPIVDQIILEGGYSYTSDFLNSFDFKNIVIPFSNKNLVPSFSNTLVFQNDGLLFSANPTGSVSVISNSSQFGSSITSFNAGNDIYDPNSFYNTTNRVFQNGISDPIAQRFGVTVDITYTDYSGSTNGWPANGDIQIWIKRSRSPQTGVTVSNWVNTPTYNQFYSYPSIPFLSTSFYSMRYVGIPQNEITHTNLGGNVWRLQGTIYSKYLTGEDIARTPLYPGEEVRFFAESIDISAPSVAFTIATSSIVFSEVDSNQATIGSLISFNNNIPKNIKQKDFLSSIMKAFNLYIEPDKNNLNNLIIEPRDDYYRKYQVIKDWSDKLDVSKNITSQILSNTQNRINYFTYKEDKDYYNSVYKTNTGQIFGEYKSETNNEFTNGERKIELLFSSTPINKITQTNNVYAPTIVNYNNGNFTKVDGMNLRLLYKNFLSLNGDIFKVRNSNNNQSFTQSFYPYAGPVNDPINPTYSLNFGQVDMFYDGYNETINNLFFNYYQNQIEELNNKNARLITAYFKLDPQDISSFRFSDLIYFKYNGTEGYYRVNKIMDYDPSVNMTTKVELITAIDYKIKRSRKYTKPIADSVRPGPIGPIGVIGIGVGNIGNGVGVVVNGDGNSFVGPKSLLFGDDNSVSTLGSVGVLGDSNQISGEYILGIGERNQMRGDSLLSVGSNVVTGTDSVAFGDQLLTIGTNNFVQGELILSAGDNNFLVGYGMINTGDNNFVFADQLTITQSNSFIVKRNNIQFIGTASFDGDIIFNGNIIGTFSTTDNLNQILTNGNDTGGINITFDDPVGGNSQNFFYNDIPSGSGSGLYLFGASSTINGFDTSGGNFNFIVATTSTQFSNNVGGGSGTITKYYNTQTTGTASVDIIISPTTPIISNLRSVNVVVRGVGSPSSNAYIANLFAGFDGSTQLSTTSIDEKTTFSKATSDIFCDASFIYVRVKGEPGDTIDWFVKVVIDE